jgi:hypothetical protein
MVSDNRLGAKHRMALLAIGAVAFAESDMVRPVSDAEMLGEPDLEPEPDPMGQADKDALAKAEAKRQRRRAKRLRDMATGSDKSSEGNHPQPQVGRGIEPNTDAEGNHL